MLGQLWNTLLYQPILLVLININGLLHNFGFSILALTILINTLLIPLRVPAQKSALKMQNLKPHLDVIKKKHGKDPKKLQEEQMKLYKEHGVNPAGGCLPLIVQFIILIALYQVLMGVITHGKIDGVAIQTQFLWFNLTKPDPFYILPIVTGLSQFILSKMMYPPKKKTIQDSKMIEKKKTEKDKKENPDFMSEMGDAMQTQMIYFMPIMTTIFALQFPSGLSLYWVTSTVFSIIQQYFINGLGGLSTWIKKS